MSNSEKPKNPVGGPKWNFWGKLAVSIGVGIMVIGYMVLAKGSMTLAPLLIIGSLFIIGIGIYNF